jgi:hypothetical protein
MFCQIDSPHLECGAFPPLLFLSLKSQEILEHSAKSIHPIWSAALDRRFCFRPLSHRKYSNALLTLFCYIFCVAPLWQYSNIQPTLLCDTFCAAPLWLFHTVLGDVPNVTSSRGLEWESPSMPPGFTHGTGFQPFCDTVSASTLRPDGESRVAVGCHREGSFR